jgi:hypothetical protein
VASILLRVTADSGISKNTIYSLSLCHQLLYPSLCCGHSELCCPLSTPGRFLPQDSALDAPEVWTTFPASVIQSFILFHSYLEGCAWSLSFRICLAPLLHSALFFQHSVCLFCWKLFPYLNGSPMCPGTFKQRWENLVPTNYLLSE